ncbi:hypothetical protein PENTCL1PPCAC_10858, partial [Pristionchus entomophagus]
AMVHRRASSAHFLLPSASGRIASLPRPSKEFHQILQSFPTADIARVNGPSVSHVPRDVLSRNAQYEERMPRQLLPISAVQTVSQGIHGPRGASTRDEYAVGARRERRVDEEICREEEEDGRSSDPLPP